MIAFPGSDAIVRAGNAMLSIAASLAASVEQEKEKRRQASGRLYFGWRYPTTQCRRHLGGIAGCILVAPFVFIDGDVRNGHVAAGVHEGDHFCGILLEGILGKLIAM